MNREEMLDTLIDQGILTGVETKYDDELGGDVLGFNFKDDQTPEEVELIKAFCLSLVPREDEDDDNE